MHSLFVAELAVNLAREIGYPHPDEAASAGLIHDLGLLWLTEYGEQYGRVLADAIDERACPPPNGNATASTTPRSPPTWPPAAASRWASPTPSPCTRPNRKPSIPPTRWCA